MKQEIFVSVDIEADGPIPGSFSLLSLGAAAFTQDRTMVGTFSANLNTLEGATGDPDTMEWWKTQPEAWAAHRVNPEDPVIVMKRFVSWVKELPGKPVFVGYPAGFDFTFLYYYMIKFAGESPFSFSALDIKSYACATMKCGYRDATKKNMPKRWFKNLPSHTHRALDDAIEQGLLFLNIREDNNSTEEWLAKEEERLTKSQLEQWNVAHECFKTQSEKATIHMRLSNEQWETARAIRIVLDLLENKFKNES